MSEKNRLYATKFSNHSVNVYSPNSMCKTHLRLVIMCVNVIMHFISLDVTTC